jgi:hypothetical protein
MKLKTYYAAYKRYIYNRFFNLTEQFPIKIGNFEIVENNILLNYVIVLKAIQVLYLDIQYLDVIFGFCITAVS